MKLLDVLDNFLHTCYNNSKMSGRKFRDAVVRLQAVLGRHHDAAVAMAVLEAMAGQHRPGGPAWRPAALAAPAPRAPIYSPSWLLR